MSRRKDLNVSRRLTRMLKAAGLPRVGGAHVLRMSYVHVTHALHVLQRQCTYQNVVRAMRVRVECSKSLAMKRCMAVDLYNVVW